MSDDRDEPGALLPDQDARADEIDRLRLALLGERARADAAESRLAALQAEHASAAELRAQMKSLRSSASFRIGSSIVAVARPLRRRR